MILSRTMRPADYDEFAPELETLNNTIALCGPVPYTHRRWEYALIQRAVKEFFGDQKGMSVADFGCSDGLSPGIMLLAGQHVSLYDVWDPAYGDKRPDAADKANKASSAGGTTYRFVDKGLGQLTDEDKNLYDVAICISTIEHIANEDAALNDIFDSLKPKGMAIITMDFFPTNTDTLYYHWLRARIYNEEKMCAIASKAAEKGFHLLGDQPDWSWSPEMIMVQGEYGFSSIVLVRGDEEKKPLTVEAVQEAVAAVQSESLDPSTLSIEVPADKIEEAQAAEKEAAKVFEEPKKKAPPRKKK